MSDIVNKPQNDDARFELLLAKSLEGDLTPEHEGELLAILAAADHRQRFLIECAMQRTMLQQLFQEQQLMDTGGLAACSMDSAIDSPAEDSSVSPQASNRPATPRRMWYSNPRTISLLVAGIIVSSILQGLALWKVPSWVGNSQVAQHKQNIVAKIISETNCTWREMKPPKNLVQGSQLSLVSGVVELEFKDGTRTWLHGPASLSLTSNNSGQLEKGKVLVQVPQQAVGFTIITPHASIIDLGTEFGAVVLPNETIVKVLSGRVEARPLNLQIQPPPRGRVVSAGETIRIERGLLMAASKESEALFAQPKRRAEHVIMSTNYRSSVIASKPLGYWRFDRRADDLVANDAAPTQPLKVTGNVISNQLPDDASVAWLRFPVEVGQARYLGLTQSLAALKESPYTLETWIRPTMLPRPGESQSLITLSDHDTQGHFFLLEILAPQSSKLEQKRGRLRLAHRSVASHQGGEQLVIENIVPVNAWMHVVAVFDGTKLKLYINGSLLGDCDCDQGFSWSPDTLAIGSLHPSELKAQRFYKGELDEVAIYAHALSVDEIQQHFFAAISDSTPKLNANSSSASPSAALVE